MYEDKKAAIKAKFPEQYEERALEIRLTQEQFTVFEKGIWASMMEEKWNVFAEDSIIWFGRSWTDHCIFKVYYERTDGGYMLTRFQVNRKLPVYKFNDLDHDEEWVRSLIDDFVNNRDQTTIWIVETTQAAQKITADAEKAGTFETPTEKVVLYEENRPDIRISMLIYFTEKGQLYFDGYDIGKSVKEWWGDSDYEYTYTIEPEEFWKFYQVFGLTPGVKQGLLMAIKDRFSGNDAYTRLGKYMDECGINYTSFTWT